MYPQQEELLFDWVVESITAHMPKQIKGQIRNKCDEFSLLVSGIQLFPSGIPLLQGGKKAQNITTQSIVIVAALHDNDCWQPKGRDACADLSDALSCHFDRA